MLTKDQEKTLKYLLSIERNSDNQISVGKNNYSLNNVTEKDFISYLNLFENSNLIKIHWHSPHHDNLICFVDITLLPDAINYFDNQKTNKKSNRREWIRTYIPITISFIALIKSFQNEIISLVKLIMQLWKQ